jgi:Anti-sigma factor NepR
VANTRERRARSAPWSLTAPQIRAAAEVLGDQLKAMFDGVASEPLPHEIVDLVDALEGRVGRGRRRRFSH